MSRLNDVIAQVVDEMISPAGRINIGLAADRVYALVEFSQIEACAKSELSRRIKQYMERGRKAAADGADGRSVGQIDLPLGLKPAHAIDEDGREMILTAQMTRAQFEQVIQVREAQVIADTAYLSKLRNVYQTAVPIWAKHPEWTLGQVVSALDPEPA